MPDKKGTAGTIILPHQAVKHPVTIVAEPFDILPKIQVTFYMWHGFVEERKNTTPGRFVIQVSADEQGNDGWFSLDNEFVTFEGEPVRQVIESPVPAGDKTIPIPDTDAFETGMTVYFQHTNQVTLGEWATVMDVTDGVAITLLDGLKFDKAAGDAVFSNGSKFAHVLEGTNARARMIFRHEFSGQPDPDAHIKASMTTWDSIQ